MKFNILRSAVSLWLEFFTIIVQKWMLYVVINYLVTDEFKGFMDYFWEYIV